MSHMWTLLLIRLVFLACLLLGRIPGTIIQQISVEADYVPGPCQPASVRTGSTPGPWGAGVLVGMREER